jgi:hypothetical protein
MLYSLQLTIAFLSCRLQNEVCGVKLIGDIPIRMVLEHDQSSKVVVNCH